MENSDIAMGSTLTIAPFVAKDMVLVGSSGAELGVRVVLFIMLKTANRATRFDRPMPTKLAKF
jgi:hypothetical protein